MSFMDFLFGKGQRTDQSNRYNPQQQQIQNQLQEGVGQNLGGAFEYLQKILSQDPELMQQFEAPARRSFQENTLPSIAEKFTGAGEGSHRSSAFGQQLGHAGAELEENLAANRAKMGGDAISQLISLLSQAQEPMQNPQGNDFGLLGNLGLGLGGGLGMLGGFKGLPALISLFGGMKKKGAPKTENAGQNQ